MLQGMSSRQLAEWMAYDRLEPFGELRADYRNGLLIATILAIMGKEADPQQFMLLPDKLGNTSTQRKHGSVAQFEQMFAMLQEGPDA